VTATAPERIAVLVVRAWHEGEGPAGLRARITWVMNVARGDELTEAAAGHEVILALITRWLDDVVACAARQPDDSV
jgi:hypothetical protein